MQERVLQTVIFEVIGLAIVVPAYGAVFSTSDAHSLRVMVLITAVVLAWAPLHNLCFDRMELHKTGRTACSRPHYLRVAHAVSLELTSVLLTLPILLLFGHPLVEALMLNGLLTAFYTGYAYLFHLFYDRLRPITKAATIAVAPSPGEHETTGSSRGGGVRGADEVRKRRIAYELEPLAVASPQEVMSEQLPSGQVGP